MMKLQALKTKAAINRNEKIKSKNMGNKMAKYPPLCEAFITQIKNRITEKNIVEINADQREPQRACLIDVRDNDEWIKGHLPNAVHIPRNKLEFLIEKVVETPDAPIILYCGGGGRSALGTNTLLQMGYTQVASMAGGYRAWCAADLPIVIPDETNG